MSETRGLYIVQPRDDNEPEIIAVFEAAGAEVERIHEIGDLYVELYGFPFLVEVKGKHGRYTPKQKKLRKRLHLIETVVTVEDALAVIDKYNTRAALLVLGIHRCVA